MTTKMIEKLGEIRSNHVMIVKGLLSVHYDPNRQPLFDKIIETRMARLHHSWFAGTSKREKYKNLERQAP